MKKFVAVFLLMLFVALSGFAEPFDNGHGLVVFVPPASTLYNFLADSTLMTVSSLTVVNLSFIDDLYVLANTTVANFDIRLAEGPAASGTTIAIPPGGSYTFNTYGKFSIWGFVVKSAGGGNVIQWLAY